MSKLAERQVMDILIIDNLIVALACFLESTTGVVKSFTLDQAINLLIVELDKARGLDG